MSNASRLSLSEEPTGAALHQYPLAHSAIRRQRGLNLSNDPARWASSRGSLETVLRSRGARLRRRAGSSGIRPVREHGSLFEVVTRRYDATNSPAKRAKQGLLQARTVYVPPEFKCGFGDNAAAVSRYRDSPRMSDPTACGLQSAWLALT